MPGLSPGNQHFLLIERDQYVVPTELINVVLNWFEELKRLGFPFCTQSGRRQTW